MSIRITTTLTVRPPTLVRVWRTSGNRLTSSWLPALLPNADSCAAISANGGSRP